jgi:hypothetical protein
MYYFAYGSNMSSARLRRRIVHMQKVTVASLHGYQLVFHKRGMDGSGKCHVQYTGEAQDRVLGVVYDICDRSRLLLDEFEGLGRGYEAMPVNLVAADRQRVHAFTYYATHLDEKLLPFDWYKQHVVLGAEEQGLPDEYIKRIRTIETIEDSNINRIQTELAVHANKRC